MIFSLIIILIFALNIFASSGFMAFGLVPVVFLGAGVGCYLLFLISRDKHYWIKQGGIPKVEQTAVQIHFSLFLILEFIFVLLMSNKSFVKYFDIFICIDRFAPYLKLVLLSGMLGILIIKGQVSPFRKWIILSLSIYLLKTVSQLIFSVLPLAIFRFFPIVDLAVIWCWLVMITKIIQTRYHVADFDSHFPQSA